MGIHVYLGGPYLERLRFSMLLMFKICLRHLDNAKRLHILFEDSSLGQIKFHEIKENFFND